MVSVHLPWGAENEYRRLSHAKMVVEQINSIMATLPKGSLAVLAGDFNTGATTDTLRYLRGELAATQCPTFWVDPWEVKGSGPGYTNDPASGNTNIIRTATAVRIPKPDMLPSRRIDFLLLRGWVYGGPGSPLKATLFGTKLDSAGSHASDHFGVMVRVWDPTETFAPITSAAEIVTELVTETVTETVTELVTE